MRNPLVLQHGRIIDPSSGVDMVGDVLINDGVIVQIGALEQLPQQSTKIECEGCIVSPGLIDLHVHFREPISGRHEETIATGAVAAAGLNALYGLKEVHYRIETLTNT